MLPWKFIYTPVYGSMIVQFSSRGAKKRKKNQNAQPFNQSPPFSLGRPRIIQEIYAFVIKSSRPGATCIRSFSLAYPSTVSCALICTQTPCPVRPVMENPSFMSELRQARMYLCTNAFMRGPRKINENNIKRDVRQTRSRFERIRRIIINFGIWCRKSYNIRSDKEN